MRFWLVHVDDRPGGPDEEVVFTVPEAKLAVFVPLAGLGDFIPILARASAEAAEARCRLCDAPLPAHARERS